MSTRILNNDYGHAMSYISDVLLKNLWFKNREIRSALKILNTSLRKTKVVFLKCRPSNKMIVNSIPQER